VTFVLSSDTGFGYPAV